MKVRNRILYFKRPDYNYRLDNIAIFSSLLNKSVTYDIVLKIDAVNLTWKDVSYQQIRNIKRNFHISDSDLRIDAIYKIIETPNYIFNNIWNF